MGWVEGLVVEISFILPTPPPPSATLHFTTIHSPVVLFFPPPPFSFLRLVPFFFERVRRRSCGGQ
jgi:hypothetical protein